MLLEWVHVPCWNGLDQDAHPDALAPKLADVAWPHTLALFLRMNLNAMSNVVLFITQMQQIQNCIQLYRHNSLLYGTGAM